MKSLHRGHSFPSEIISHAVWLYHGFTLSFRDVADLVAERGVTVSYEAVRLWCRNFGTAFARNPRRRQGQLGDVWHLDEVLIRLRGERRHLWRAVDQDGDVLNILVTRRRDARAAKRLFRKLLKGQGRSPWQLAIDQLGSYATAGRELGLSANHRTGRYENNKRVEAPHQYTRERERQMRHSKWVGQAVGKTLPLQQRSMDRELDGRPKKPWGRGWCSETSCCSSGWKSRRRNSQFGAVVISGRHSG